MSDLLQKSLVGLAILVVIALENLILCKKKTIPVMLCDQMFFGCIAYIFFGWLTLIYSTLLIAFLLFIKYRNHQAEEADLDYSGRILSISAVLNKLSKPKNLVIGRIQPVNHKEIRYNQKAIELDNIVLSGAMFITGSTGSGKTTTMKTILKQRIDEHKPVVFFDYKGEEDILDEIKSYAQSNHMPYYEFSARDCNFTYDPFINLNDTGKVEALMNTRRWSTTGVDEHYKTSMQLAIQNLIKFYDEYRIKEKEQCNYIAGLYEFSKTYRPQSNERDGFSNLQKSLEILLSSKAKVLFANDPNFTFEREDAYVICFSFTSANKALANYISSFVYTDLMDRGTRHMYKDKLLLCIDEFGTLESSTLIKDLLEKGRSGGVQTIFSILDVNQIAMNAGDHFVNAILGTINSYIIHAGATQSTADLLAGVQKYDKGYDIMSLRKPYRGKKPTALFITKYGLLSKKNNQDVFRIIPYTSVLKNVTANNSDKESNATSEEDEIMKNVNENGHYVIPIEELDLSQPIDNIDDYL